MLVDSLSIDGTELREEAAASYNCDGWIESRLNREQEGFCARMTALCYLWHSFLYDKGLRLGVLTQSISYTW